MNPEHDVSVDRAPVGCQPVTRTSPCRRTRPTATTTRPGNRDGCLAHRGMADRPAPSPTIACSTPPSLRPRPSSIRFSSFSPPSPTEAHGGRPADSTG
jgi:hypothetical protein